MICLFYFFLLFHSIDIIHGFIFVDVTTTTTNKTKQKTKARFLTVFLSCRLQHPGSLGSGSSHQPKPGDEFSSSLYLSSVPVGDVGSPQSRPMARDTYYTELKDPQMWLVSTLNDLCTVVYTLSLVINRVSRIKPKLKKKKTVWKCETWCYVDK